MATALETLRKKALRGVVRNVEEGFYMGLVHIEVAEETQPITTELSKEEIAQLQLAKGDQVDVIPIDFETYLVVGKPKQ